MDLLEIRKKAKGMKEAREDAPPAGPKEAQIEKTAAAEAGDAPSPEAAEIKKKKPGKKRGAPKKAITEAPVAVDEPAGTVPEPAAGPPEEPAAPPQSVPPAGSKAGVPPSGVGEAAPDAPGPEQKDGVEEEVEYLTFMLASEEYAVRVDEVKEIIRPQRTTQVPRTPGFVVGIISLRGVILPVLNIKMRLGFPDAGSAKTTRIIIVSDGGSPLGILVDRVTGVARLRKGEIEPPPAVIGGVESEYLHGVGRQGDRLLILFNTQRVLEMEGR